MATYGKQVLAPLGIATTYHREIMLLKEKEMCLRSSFSRALKLFCFVFLLTKG